MFNKSKFAAPLVTASVACFGTFGLQSQSTSGRSLCTSAKKTPYRRVSMKDKVVLITGATAGIGKSCSEVFAEEGSKLILIGRRADKLEELKNDLTTDHPGLKVHTVSMSVADVDAVAKLPEELPDDFKDVYLLVNNAGLALGLAEVQDVDIADAKTVLDTNVLGLIAFNSAFLPGMKERKAGHVINMGSIAGHLAYGRGSVYNASKYAVNGYTQATRFDLMNTPIRITHISPGLVGSTEFSKVRFANDEEKAAKVYEGLTALHPDDIADQVLYAATRPEHVQIADIICLATNQAAPRDIARVGPSLGADSM